MSDYDNATTDPRHGGKLTADMMPARIRELEGDIQILRLQLAARRCSECPAKARIADDVAYNCLPSQGEDASETVLGRYMAAREIAAAIRARGKTG